MVDERTDALADTVSRIHLGMPHPPESHPRLRPTTRASVNAEPLRGPSEQRSR